MTKVGLLCHFYYHSPRVHQRDRSYATFWTPLSFLTEANIPVPLAVPLGGRTTAIASMHISPVPTDASDFRDLIKLTLVLKCNALLPGNFYAQHIARGNERVDAQGESFFNVISSC